MTHHNLTNMTKKVLSRLLTKNEPMKAQHLVNDLQMNLRSVRYALKLLAELELVERQPDLRDLRSHYYFVRTDNIILVKKLLN